MDAVRSVTPEERRRALEQISAEVSVCMRCPLGADRTLAVPGEGSAETEVVFVGEGPGYNEDQQGRPFVGAAGTLLNELLKQIGWRRQDVYITNVVKCRPPGNRDPEPSEIEACAPFLKRQLKVLDPAVVVTLGRHSLQTFNPGARIGQTHGTVLPVDPATGASNALTYAMYHPAAALRAGALKRTMLEDMCGLPQALLDSRERREPSVTADVAQETITERDEQAADEPVALDVEPELIAVAIAQDPLADQMPVDENQISLF
jgi:uracil-DNA glycosylase